MAELGTYGLTATLAVYLLVIKNSISSSGLRAMTAAADEREQVASFSTATVLYAGAALATGLLILAAGWGISALVLDGELAAEARRGTALLAAVTAVGLTATVNLDALRAALRLTRSAANEIAALGVFAALMLGLIAAGAPLVGPDRGKRIDPADQRRGQLRVAAHAGAAVPVRARRWSAAGRRA